MENNERLLDQTEKKKREKVPGKSFRISIGKNGLATWTCYEMFISEIKERKIQQQKSTWNYLVDFESN